MIKYMLIALLLTGCSTTVPVTAKFPAAPKSLMEKCNPLKKIQGEQVTIVDLHATVVENYTSHHECSVKVEAWQEWYTSQKKIFEEVK
jgi:uncharacterized protein YcfL